MSAESRILAHVADRLDAVEQFARNGRRMLAVCEASPALLDAVRRVELEAEHAARVIRAGAIAGEVR